MLAVLAAATALAAGVSVSAVPCVQFDAEWSLYAFGGSDDVKLGTSDSWGSPNPTTLTTSGRPPWTGNATQCFLSQFNNAMYVLGADESDLTKVYIYDFAGDAWSTQSTTSPPSNLGGRSGSVLDHDTNVIFTLPSGSGAGMYQLDMSSVTKSASGSGIAWEAVTNPSFQTSSDSQTTMAQASNHINFFGVSGTAAGSANIFVIHYAYFQPEAQEYPTVGGGSAFPDTAGQAVSVPDTDNNAGTQMIFIPDSASNTYVVTHWTNPGDYASTDGAPFATDLINSTQLLPAPSTQNGQAAYAASPSDIVQVNPNGDIYYLAGAINNYQVNSGASWAKMSYSLSGGGLASGGNSSTGGGGASSSSASASGGSATSGPSASGSSASASAASGGASESSAPNSARATSLRFDIAGLTLGFVAVGMALIL